MRSLLKVIKQNAVNRQEKIVLIPDGITPCRISEENQAAAASLSEMPDQEIYQSLVEQAREEGELISSQLVQQAQLEREVLLEEARAQAQLLFAEAQQAGYAAGLAQREEQIAATLGGFERSLAEVRRLQQEYFETYTDTLQDFSIEVAARILDAQITLDPLIIRQLVENVIQSIKETDWISVKLSPGADALAQLLRSDTALARETAGTKLEFLQGDLPPGGCILETPAGSIDASIHTQLENLRSLFSRL